MTGYPQLVTENVLQQVPPAPVTLQQSGAVISQGGTTLVNGGTSLITQPSDLTPLLSASLALTSLVWSGGTVVATTSAAISGLSSGDKFLTTIAGAVPSGYNGTVAATVTGTNTFTYALASNPGSETGAGTYTPNNVVELQNEIANYFAQGLNQSCYVLELGAGDGTSGPPALQTWITANPGIFYLYLVPRYWDSTAAYLALVALYEGLAAKTYFFTTTTTANYANYTTQMKSVVRLIEAPTTLPAGTQGSARPLTEYDMAAPFQIATTFSPSSSNLARPLAQQFLYGVTPYPTGGGNSALFQTWLTANVSFVGTAAEGGITTAALFGGKTADGKPFSYWQSVDWIQLQADQALANALYNAANSGFPIDYDQGGINTLQDVLVGVVNNGISFNLATGTVVQTTLTGTALAAAVNNGVYPDTCIVNAVPFTTYALANPANYAAGIYGGFSIVWQVNQFFSQIILQITATQIISA
jgi:hypothetical protein